MSLEKRSIPVQVTGGLQKGEDDFATEGNVRVRDCRYRLDGQIGKRNGATDRRSTGLPLTTVADRNAIVELDGVPMVLTSDGDYRRNIVDGTWDAMNVGAPRPSRIVTSPLVRTNDTLIGPNCAVIGNLLCSVWQDRETGQGFYAFYDVSKDTPRLVSGPTVFDASVKGQELIDHLRVVAVGATANVPDRFVLIGRVGYTATEDLRQSSYVLSAGDFTFNPVTTLVLAGATAFVTVCPSANATTYYIAASTGVTARLYRYDVSQVLLASIALAVAANLPLCLVHNSVLAVVVGLAANGNLTHAVDDLSAVSAAVTVLSAPPSTAAFTFLRAAICIADGTGNMWCARSTDNRYAIGAPTCTQMVQIDTAYAALSAETVVGQYQLAAEAFYTALLGPVFVVADQFTDVTTTPPAGTIALLQAPIAYFIRPTRAPNGSHVVAALMLGRFLQDTAYPFNLSSHLPQIAIDLATSGNATTTQRARLCFSTGTSDYANFQGQKIDLVDFSLWLADAARNVTAQGLRLLGNGCGSTMIDGMMHAENTPQPPAYLGVDGADAAITQASNVYFGGGVTGARIVIVWRWVDAKGNVHRSAPSSIYENNTTFSSGGGNNPYKIVFPAYAPTGLMGDQFTTPEVEVYLMLLGAGSADFRLIGIVPPKADPTEEGRVYIAACNTSVSVPAASAIRHRVNISGWDASKPALYTDTDELASWPAPPLLDLVSTQSRLWGLSAEGQRLDVWYTKPIADQRAPEWNDTLRVLVPQEGGDVVALAGLDDKVAVLKRRRIFVITGEPGDATGAGSSMQQPRALASDVGCIDVNSVIEGPFGVAFLSERGWYTLSRDLELSFIGQPMIDAFAEDWSLSTYPQPIVLSSDIVPSESEVRWAIESTRGGKSALVAAWNYRLNKWNVWTAADVRSLCVADGVEWRLGYAALRQETPNAWANGPPDTQEIIIPWLKLNGIAGFQRVWRIVLTFRWYSAAILVKTTTDYLPETETLKSWTSGVCATLADPTTHRLQLVINPTVQKCEALRVHIISVGTGGEAGQGFELVGCQLDIGVKKGSNKKLPAAARG